MKIQIELSELEDLLNQQKRLVIERLLSNDYSYNKESTEGNLKSLAIKKDIFGEIGMSTPHPNDVSVLKKYII